MGILAVGSTVEAPDAFIDVVYLSDKPDLPLRVKRLFRQKKISFQRFPLAGYRFIHARPDRVGTVIVDLEGMQADDQMLGTILETLERDNLGAILLTQRIAPPVRSFSLVSSDKSFSVAKDAESISLDALWARVSVNLADRKKEASGITFKPPAALSAVEKRGVNKPSNDPDAHDNLMDNLTEQLRLAGLVQRDFLPSQLPNCEEVQWATTFTPAEWVSGDIYDIARIDEQHIGFYIADAVGHSMPAALLTIFIKQALAMRETKDNSYRIFAPTEVMSHLNMRMVGQKLSGYQFATCCYCLLNIKTRQLTFARGGHPYPILFRQGQSPQQLETRGALLGVFDNAEFAQQSVQLQPGDRVLLYSDGAESMIGQLVDEKGFQFSQAILALQDAPISEIVDTLTKLADRRDLKPGELDDVTLLGLQIP